VHCEYGIELTLAVGREHMTDQIQPTNLPLAQLPRDASVEDKTMTSPPAIALLSNGSYGVMITCAGAGYSTWR